MVYRVSSMIAKVTEKPCLENKTNKNKTKEKKKKNGNVHPVNLEVYNDIMCYLFLKM